jgi:hypothetical protein
MRSAPVFTFLLLLGVVNVGAQNIKIAFSFGVDNYSKSKILDSLSDGHRSEVRYEFRLLREARGLGKIFGDRLVKEDVLSYVARWDAFDEKFVVVVDGSAERSFDDSDGFLAFFLAVRNRTMIVADGLDDGDYLLCRWRIQPVKLVPPLTLMTIFRSDLQVISSWKRTDFMRISP